MSTFTDRLVDEIVEAEMAELETEFEAFCFEESRAEDGWDGAHFVDIDSDDGSPEWLTEYNEEDM